jgi:uncharacterized protein DUF3359
MRVTKLALAAPLLLLGACTSLSDADRAMLTNAAQNAEQARVQSAQAQEAACAAQASAAAAAQNAERAAADARAANEKADRMFQRQLRK